MPLLRTVQLGLLAKDLALLRISSAGGAKDRARQRLVERLGLLHGLPQKIGQLLAFSEIDESSPAFTKLTENEPALTADEARAEVARQLGGPIEEFFATFEPTGIAASIGQVHRATLHDGRTVAVKFQLPGIAAAIDHDLRALGWLTAPVGDLRRGFDLAAYRTEIGESLHRELDYRIEAASITRFAALARTLNQPVLVPEVITGMCNEHLLVTTWLYGEPLAAARKWPLTSRAALSASLIELFFQGLLDWGLLHADPHPGNYRFLHCHGRPTVGLLDFGCMKQIPPAIQAGIRNLIADALHYPHPSPISDLPSPTTHVHFARMGFNPAVLDKLRDKLPALATALTLPFRTPGPFDAARWNLRDHLGEILGEDRMTFRTAGPPELIFILRAFQGLLHYLKILDAPVDWREAVNQVPRTKDQVPNRENPNANGQTPIQTLTASPANHPPVTCPLSLDTSSPPQPVLQSLGAGGAPDPIPHPPSPISFLPSPPPLSSTLHILVEENGATKVSLIYGAEAAADLADLVPEDMLIRLRERSINLDTIAAQATRQNFAPGELFSLLDGAKAVRVWLE